MRAADNVLFRLGIVARLISGSTDKTFGASVARDFTGLVKSNTLCAFAVSALTFNRVYSRRLNSRCLHINSTADTMCRQNQEEAAFARKC